MNPYVPTELRNSLVRAAEHGNDPLRLRPIYRDPAQHIAQALTVGLTHPDEKACLAMGSQVAETHDGELPGIDFLVAELMRSVGMEPLTVVWMAIVHSSFIAIEDDGRGEQLRYDDQEDCWSADALTCIEIASGHKWFSNGTLFLPEPPATVLNGCIGMRLRDLVSHPVLDRRDIGIEDLSEEARIGDAGFVTDAAFEPMTAVQLLETALERQRG